MDVDVNDEFRMIAEQAYKRGRMVREEFEEELNRIQYIKRLLSRYYKTKVLKELLVRNHLVIFFNVFGLTDGYRMLCMRLDDRDLSVLRPMIIYIAKYNGCYGRLENDAPGTIQTETVGSSNQA